MGKLEGFYKKKSFLQKQAEIARHHQTPPGGGFTKMKTNSGASPVMGMISAIIEDSAKLEAESEAGEKKAQAEYELFVKDSNSLIKTLSTSVTEKTKAIASTKSKSASAKGDLESAEGELKLLAKVEADLHAECDFVLKNFETRQDARLKEMEAIQAAMSILSGAKSAF